MERIFWVACPACGKEFYCDYALRHSEYKLICPGCQREFKPEESPNIDERQR